MYTIDDLADELNRQEWAVERMLKNRGYLKQNGDPRKSTINNGLMDEDGYITDDGWITFIDELGYKNSGSDDDDEEEDDDDDVKLPKICSSYGKYDKWKISVTKDVAHKYVITADLHGKYRDEFGHLVDEGVIKTIEINGDKIPEGTDVESYVKDKIDECEEELADKEDWIKNYAKHMSLDEDPDWCESY